VSLALAAGERVALMGPNGGGKSTLLKCLVGLLAPREGAVEVLGRAVSGRPLTEITAVVGFVPQNPARLLFNDTVAEEIRFTRRSHGLAREGDERAAAELLGRLGLTHRADAWPADLSTGERQRAALAAILAAGPRVLLLDEPTRGLDYARKDELARLLTELAAAGTAVLVATHDVELMARWAERVVVLEEGRIAADGGLREVLPRFPALAPQILRLFGDPRLLTEEDVP
jgi:energy-coupling factor transport system ATP-binding protein